MANKKGNPLSGAFRSPAPDDSPPWEEKKTVPDPKASITPSKPGEDKKPTDPPKVVTPDPKASTTPNKPGEEKRPTDPPKVVTPDPKATTTPSKPGEEKKSTEPPKVDTPDPKATTTPSKPGEDKKPTEPPKVDTPDPKATTTPSKPGEDKKPTEPPKEVTPNPKATTTPGKPGENKKPADRPKTDTPDPKATTTPGKPGEDKKPADPPKEVTPGPKATTTTGKPGEDKKPADPPKEVTPDPKATTTPGKPGEDKKPTKPPKEVTPDPKAATTPGKPDEDKKPTEPPKEGTSDPKATTTPDKPSEEKKPVEQVKDPSLRFVKLSQIVPLPGTYVKDTPRADYKNLIASIKQNGLEKPVILRRGEKGDYQLVDGFHRCKALEQAGMLEIRAEVYDMTITEASRYRREHRTTPDLPIPGKLIPLQPPAPEKPAEEKKPAEPPKTAAAPQAPGTAEQEATRTAEGPKGSTVTHIFDDRLDAPGDDDLHSLPIPKEGEVYSIALHPAYFRDFLDHPFSVNRETQDYKDLYESIKTYGIREPVKCRPGRDGGVEIISGHRRHDIGMQLNYPIPTIIEQIDEDDAQIQCVDGNLHRKDIPISELARAAEMKMEALKRKQGRRSKADILAGTGPMKRTDELVGEDLGMSRSSVQRLMRVNKLEESLKQMVDKKELPLDIAEPISHMKPEEQKKLADAIEKEGGKVPSKTEAVKLKEESKAGKLTTEKIEKAVAPTKRETEPELKVTFNNEELRPYFPDKGATVGDVKRGVFEALAMRKKALERQAAKESEKGGKPKKPPTPAR